MKKAFKSVKFFIGPNPETSKAIQEVLFRLGYGWNGGHTKVIKFEDRPYLYACADGSIEYSDVNTKHYFDAEPHQEVDIGWMKAPDLETIMNNQRSDEIEPSSGREASDVSDLLRLDALDDLTQAERIELLDDALHRLAFERRYAALTEKQIEHMLDEGISSAQRQRLASCETEAERDRIITDYARAKYFRQCLWVNYLNGVDEIPPVEA